jgi:choline dehydrogenase-like flavoprotein
VNPLEIVVRRERMRRHDGSVDVCIVGCGAGGSVLAKELAEGGWKVVVLEAGDWLSTDEDLRQDELHMLGRFDWDDRRWLTGGERLELGHRRDGRGVGGGTLHFGGVALRMWPEDFRRRSLDGVPTPLAILTKAHEGRSPCMNYGYCQWGCKSRAKTSVHLNYVPKAVLAGAEIRTGARAIQIEVDGTGRAIAVVYVRNGRTER